MNRTTINKPVAITAVSFRGRQGLSAVPRRMEFDGNIYTFQDAGLQYLIKKGAQRTRILDLTDGLASFRLRSEDETTWTLVSITQ